MRHGEQFEQLARQLPDHMIKRAPQGKFGSYVPHYDIAQRALSVIGPHDFSVIEPIRGHAVEIQGKDKTYQARDGAIVGAICELKAVVDGQLVTIREIGTEDKPAMHHDAENLKRAASDGYKRCWMRLGLGLHLWCTDGYWLHAQIEKDNAED